MSCFSVQKRGKNGKIFLKFFQIYSIQTFEKIGSTCPQTIEMRRNLYVGEMPGGAKFSCSNSILTSELNRVNQEKILDF